VINPHDPVTDNDEEFQRLIDRSSLGTPGARVLRKRTPPERLDAMNAAVDRVWSIRDAVLKWLYLKSMVDGHRQGYISGPGAWGGGVVRPSISPKGEALADAGRSVRGGDSHAEPQGAAAIRISNSANIAIHSPAAQQSFSVSMQLEKIATVAAALERAAQLPNVSPETAGEAERTAAEIRAEVSRFEPDHSKLKHLLFSAMTRIAAGFGQATGTDVAHLASEALQTF
jgi:hypothetical protein